MRAFWQYRCATSRRAVYRLYTFIHNI